MPLLRRLATLLAVLFVAFAAADVSAQPLAPIRYTIRFPAPQTNYFDVEAIVPTGGQPSTEMLMAVWTPGSYLVREYERNVEGVRAFDGVRPLAVDKPVKNRWRIATGGAREVRLAYRVYSHEMTVRNNWVDETFALMNGAQTFLTLSLIHI